MAKCELCMTNYPDQIEYDGSMYDLFEIELPKNTHYLVMEVLGMPVGKNIQVISVPDADYI